MFLSIKKITNYKNIVKAYPFWLGFSRKCYAGNQFRSNKKKILWMIKSEIIWKMWTIYCITNLCFRMAFLVLFYELREKWKAFNNFIVFFLSIYHKEYEYFKLSVSKITICVWFVHHAQNNNIFIYGKDREKGIASFHKNRLCAIRGCLSKRLLLLLPLFSFFLLPWKRFKNYDKWSVSILTVWSGINFFIGKKKIQNKQNNKISVFFLLKLNVESNITLIRFSCCCAF